MRQKKAMVPADNVRRENKEPKKSSPELERTCQRQERTKGNWRTGGEPDPMTGNNEPDWGYQGDRADRRREQGKQKV